MSNQQIVYNVVFQCFDKFSKLVVFQHNSLENLDNNSVHMFITEFFIIEIIEIIISIILSITALFSIIFATCSCSKCIYDSCRHKKLTQSNIIKINEIINEIVNSKIVIDQHNSDIVDKYMKKINELI